MHPVCLKYGKKNHLAAWAPPRTPLEELTALPRLLAGGEGAGYPFPKNLIPAVGPSGLDSRPPSLKP